MANLPKPADRRQNRVTKKPEQVLDLTERLEVAAYPPPPKGIRAELVQTWADYWASPLANATDQASKLHAVTRLWELYDLRDRLHTAFAKQPMVMGSQGQQVLNPIGRQLNSMESQIIQLEDRLGLNPRSQLTLGVTWAAGQNQLADLAERYAAPMPEPRDDEDDPRKALAI
jgi:hypothetical protein